MNNVIKLFGEINQNMYNYVFDEVMKILDNDKHSQVKPTSKITILINSTKGDYYQGVAILNLLGLLEKNIKCIVLGNSCDATNVIFLSFLEKYHSPTAIFHFDEYFFAYENLITNADFKYDIISTIRSNNNGASLYEIARRNKKLAPLLVKYGISTCITNYDLIKEYI